MGGSEKLAVHHGFPESGTASAIGTANSQGARPAANSSLEPTLLLLHSTPNDVSGRLGTVFFYFYVTIPHDRGGGCLCPGM